MLFGIENSAPERRQRNRQNVAAFQGIFEGRILGISAVLHEYARQKAVLRRMGKPMDDFDLLIGCTAIVHDLTLVTRNVRHFENLDRIKLENWVDQ